MWPWNQRSKYITIFQPILHSVHARARSIVARCRWCSGGTWSCSWVAWCPSTKGVIVSRVAAGGSSKTPPGCMRVYWQNFGWSGEIYNVLGGIVSRRVLAIYVGPYNFHCGPLLLSPRKGNLLCCQHPNTEQPQLEVYLYLINSGTLIELS